MPFFSRYYYLNVYVCACAVVFTFVCDRVKNEKDVVAYNDLIFVFNEGVDYDVQPVVLYKCIQINC